MVLTLFLRGVRICFVRGGGRKRLGKLKQLTPCEVLMPNISLLLGLESFEKFSVVGGWVVDTTVNIVFCFGPRLGLKTEV